MARTLLETSSVPCREVDAKVARSHEIGAKYTDDTAKKNVERNQGVKLLTESSNGSRGRRDRWQPRGAPRPERCRGGVLCLRAGASVAAGATGGGGVVRERVDGDGDLHALQAEAVAADEEVAAGLRERDEVLPGGPVAGDPVHGAVVVPRLVHLEHVVRPLLVPERCTRRCVVS